MFLSLLRKFILFWAKHSRVEIITGHGEDTPYLVRFHLINNRFFKLYAHRFMRRDLDVPHSHPWSYVTLVLSGQHTEELYDIKTQTFTKMVRSTTSNRLIYRDAEAIHRVIVDQALPMERIDEAPMTLFFATKKSKEWGFIKDYDTPNPVFVHWKEYLGQ